MVGQPWRPACRGQCALDPVESEGGKTVASSDGQQAARESSAVGRMEETPPAAPGFRGHCTSPASLISWCWRQKKGKDDRDAKT